MGRAELLELQNILLGGWPMSSVGTPNPLGFGARMLKG